MRALFIADLHLSARDSDTGKRFNSFITEALPGADHLYILGDLFHVWLGDDLLAHDSHARHITEQLQQASHHGTRIHIQRGNRDFMLGPRFAQACGGQLIDEQTLIDLGGTPTLLLHGDELCTDDRGYQRLRRILRSRAFFHIASRLPISWRRQLAQRIQRASRRGKQRKTMAIMDVNPDTVEATLQRSGARQLIHGHTHRPAHHHHAHGERWVLSDWQQDYGYLEWQDGHFHVRPWPEA